MINYFDALAVFILLLTLYYGYQTGIITSFFYIMAGFVGMWLANKFAYGSVTNFYVFFLLAAFSIIGIGLVVRVFVKKFFLSPIDRFGGALLGFLLGVVVISFALVPLSINLPKGLRKLVMSSYSAKHLNPVMERAFPAVAELQKKQLDEVMPEVKVPKALSQGIKQAGDKISDIYKPKKKKRR